MNDDMWANGSDKPKTPSVKFDVKGHEYVLTVTEAPAMVQARDFATGELATWPDGNPKFNVVVRCTDAMGVERNLWIPKPSAMYAAFATEIGKLGRNIGPGDVVRVAWTGEEPANNPKFMRKTYKVAVEAAPF